LTKKNALQCKAVLPQSEAVLSIYIGYKHMILKMLKNVREILGETINIDII
jgi:hypothetical protein